MNEQTKQVIAYIYNELNQVYVQGSGNIAHMGAALANLDMLLREPIEQPEGKTGDQESEPEEK